jgi:hypothetical protein
VNIAYKTFLTVGCINETDGFRNSKSVSVSFFECYQLTRYQIIRDFESIIDQQLEDRKTATI